MPSTMTSAELVQGVLWSANFLLLLIWLVFGKLAIYRDSSSSRYWLKVTMGGMACTLLLAYVIFFELPWPTWTALVLLVLLPALTHGRLPHQRYGIEHDLVSPRQAVLSWFTHAAQLFVIGLALSSNLWFIGATILLTAALLNFYIEITLKQGLYYLASSSHFTSLSTGFIRPEEYSFILSVSVTGLLFFPGAWIVERLGQIVGLLVVGKGSYFVYLVPTLFAAMIAICSRKKESHQEATAVARIYRGYVRILAGYSLLIVTGWLLHTAGSLDIESALCPASIIGSNPRVLLSQLWLATSSVVLLALIALTPPITFSVLGGWRLD